MKGLHVYLLIVLFVTIAALAFIRQRHEVLKLGYEISVLEQEKAELVEQRHAINCRLAQLKSVDSLVRKGVELEIEIAPGERPNRAGRGLARPGRRDAR